MIGDSIFEACLSWLNTGVFPEGLNDTNIVLILECENPISMKDFGPISLCNMVYKILAKTLVNRLSTILSRVVSMKQSAFVKGRSR